MSDGDDADARATDDYAPADAASNVVDEDAPAPLLTPKQRGISKKAPPLSEKQKKKLAALTQRGNELQVDVVAATPSTRPHESLRISRESRGSFATSSFRAGAVGRLRGVHGPPADARVEDVSCAARRGEV